jgi:hypothetical protein
MVSAGRQRVAGVQLPAGQAPCRVAVTALALPGNDACCSVDAGFPRGTWFPLFVPVAVAQQEVTADPESSFAGLAPVRLDVGRWWPMR